MKRRDFIKSTFALSAIGSCLPHIFWDQMDVLVLEIQTLVRIR